MSLPTLLIKGNLRTIDNDPKDKKKLDEFVPLEYILEWFRTRLGRVGVKERVMILKSETASGKSTAFPPALYRTFVKNDTTRGIICTQPRVMTAIENVHTILEHSSGFLRLGESIGWSTKANKLAPINVGLLSATVGTLAQQMKTMTDNEIMDKYQFILIDETHERDMQTDMTIYMLKNLLLRQADNPKCPFVVLMSATFDPDPLLKYFGLTYDNFIWCTGATAKIDEEWKWNEDRVVPDFTKAAADVVTRILETGADDDPKSADIIIFMPGAVEITKTAEHLAKINEAQAAEGKNVMSVMQIDGDAVRIENMDFKKTVRIPTSQHVVTINGVDHVPSRRCIISTNVAETGLTLPNLKYVIDAGYNREVEFYPAHNIDGLVTKPAPRSRIWQRRGRAGRRFPGVFYPLYPEYIFDRLPKNQLPQILTGDVSSIMLDIVIEQLRTKSREETDPEFDPNTIDMIDVPGPDALTFALEKLYNLGFISTHAPKWADVVSGDGSGSSGHSDDHTRPRFSITHLGMIAYKMSLPLEISRMILAAYKWGASIMDVVTIAAWLQSDPESYPATTSKDERADWTTVYREGLPGFLATDRGLFHKWRLLVADEFMVGLVLFRAIAHVISGPDSHLMLTRLTTWCAERRIKVKSCVMFLKIREEIIEQLLLVGMNLGLHDDNSLSNSSATTFMDTVTG